MAASRETTICTVDAAKKELGGVLIEFGSILKKGDFSILPTQTLLDLLDGIENIKAGLPRFKQNAINIIENTQTIILDQDIEKFRDKILDIIKYIQISMACLKKAEECRSTDTLRGDVEQLYRQVIEFHEVYGYLLEIVKIVHGML